MSRLTLAALAAAALLTGCGGGSDDKEQITTAIKTYLTSFAQGDGKTACDQLTGQAQRQMVSDAADLIPEFGATTCAEVIDEFAGNTGRDEQKALIDADVQDIKVTGTSATVMIVGATRPAELTKTDAGWLISGGLRLG